MSPRLAAAAGRRARLRPLVQVRGLEKSFALHGREVRALEGVDLDLLAGETYSLVGESGSGKTTLGRCLLRLLEPGAGTIRFAGEELTTLPRTALRRRRAAMQMIFQDPYGSLNPRMKVGRVLEEPLRLHRIVRRDQRSAEVARLLEQVGLGPAVARRYPHQLSGGERQRVGIARALASRPRLVVADEPVSALDVSVQGQVLNLLADLGSELGLTLLLISHDLAVVERISDRVGVLYRGRIVEEGPVAAVTSQPRHPYTAALLSAVPIPEPGRRRDFIALREPAHHDQVPSGCAFHPRCPIAQGRCAQERPVARPDSNGHFAACHFPGELEVQRSLSTV